MNDKLEIKNRITEIIGMANQLGWIKQNGTWGYPLMQLSEVEKCLVAMVDDFELNEIRKWVDLEKKTRRIK